MSVYHGVVNFCTHIDTIAKRTRLKFIHIIHRPFVRHNWGSMSRLPTAFSLAPHIRICPNPPPRHSWCNKARHPCYVPTAHALLFSFRLHNLAHIHFYKPAQSLCRYPSSKHPFTSISSYSHKFHTSFALLLLWLFL